MKAIRIQTYGSADVMTLDDVPIVDCEANGLLVRVVAAGVNSVDWKIRSGAMAQQLHKKFPITLGQDAAGIVVDVGSASSGFKLGDAAAAHRLGESGTSRGKMILRVS